MVVDVEDNDEIMRIKFFQLMFDKDFDELFKDHPLFNQEDQ